MPDKSCNLLNLSKGDVPLDEENNVPLSAIKHGPLVDRTGYRCKKCMMNIHINCAEEAERLKEKAKDVSINWTNIVQDCGYFLSPV